MLTQFKKNKSLTLLLSLLLLILLMPLFDTSRVASLLYVLLYTTVLLAGVYAISDDVRYIGIGILLAAPILVCRWSNIVLNNPTIDILSRVCSTIFMAYTLVALLQRVLKAPKVGIDEIYAAICAYILIGTVFGLFFTMMETVWPGSFHFNHEVDMHHLVSLVYFSFVALSTAGFGDIVPVAPFARSLVVIEMITGVVYIAVLIGRLVSASFMNEKSEIVAESKERKQQQKMLREMLRGQVTLKQKPIGVILACVMLNFVTSTFLTHTHLPFFLDSWGTSLAVILGGGWIGAITAVLYNLLMAATSWGWSSWIWMFSSLLIAGTTWFFHQRKWVDILRPLHLIGGGMLAGFLNGILVQILIFFARLPPYEGTLPVYRFFLKATSNLTFAALAEKMFVEIADKSISLVIAAGAAFLLHDFLAGYKKTLEA